MSDDVKDIEKKTDQAGFFLFCLATLAITILLWAWFGWPFPGRYTYSDRVRIDTWTGEVCGSIENFKPGLVLMRRGNGNLDY